MDLSWIGNLSPLVVLELIFGIVIFILLAKHTGLSFSKDGLHFRERYIQAHSWKRGGVYGRVCGGGFYRAEREGAFYFGV
jgi:hypothetical protein